MRRDVYFSWGNVLFLSGGRHLENEMCISSGKMYISTGEMYISIWRLPDISDLTRDRRGYQTLLEKVGIPETRRNRRVSKTIQEIIEDL